LVCDSARQPDKGPERPGDPLALRHYAATWTDSGIGTHVVVVFKDGVLHVLGDGLGACKIYSDQQETIWSNSFLAMLELCSPRLFDTQACYEYVCNGSVFGGWSMASEPYARIR
jgi:hypothetical protein